MADKILYVDDESINAYFFESIFSEKFNVVTAGKGSDAIGLVQSDKDIKLILTDYKMPEMNGVSLIKEVKRMMPSLPCFIVTGYTEEEEITEALGADLISGIIKKPYAQDALFDLIGKYVS